MDTIILKYLYQVWKVNVSVRGYVMCILPRFLIGVWNCSGGDFFVLCHLDAYDDIVFAVMLQIMCFVYHQPIRRSTNAVTGD